MSEDIAIALNPISLSIGLVLYFLGAIVSHLRVDDVKGIGPAAFMLALAGGALALRNLSNRPGISG